MGSGGWGSEVRLMDVNTGRLPGIKYRLLCSLKLAEDMVRGLPPIETAYQLVLQSRQSPGINIH